MKRYLLFFILTSLSLSSLSGESVIALEVKDIFGKLGYQANGVVQLESGDFGEGGGGNRPIKTINITPGGDDSILYYYPAEYRVLMGRSPHRLLKKVPLHLINKFNIIGQGKKISLRMDDIFSFDLSFDDLIDLNNISILNISAIMTMQGDVFYPYDIHSFEIEAIIEP